MKKILMIALSLMVIGMIGMAISSMVFGIGSTYGQYNHEEVITKDFKQVDIEVNTLSMEVINTKDNEAAIEIKNAKNENQVKYEVQDDTLKITGGESKGINVDFNFGFTKEEDNMKVILHLPLAQYEQFKVNADVGDIDIDTLDAKVTTIDLNVGDVKVNEVLAKDLQFKVDVGDLTLRNINKDINLKGNVNVGNADIYYKEKPDNVNIVTDTNMGDITLNDVIPKGGMVGKGEHKIDLESNMGDISIDLE
ncbi:DUF4097 family beta strand repeat-containing protein [Macrococcus animalis]|uniref:DUF4097 family beta strand repeat-containing protein n=1 Tax=Macrococcus animalis TaxID=3395467 RepID=UPI0039BE5619